MNVSNLNVQRLLPETTDYVTYEGSQTTPGCHETVTWILMNKPLYITSYQVNTGNNVISSSVFIGGTLLKRILLPDVERSDHKTVILYTIKK